MKRKSIINSTVITGYLFLLSIAYLWGFWGNFGINILQFITITDIIKSAIMPMIVSLTLYIAQVAMHNYNSPTVAFKDLRNLEKPEKILNGMKYLYIAAIAIFIIGSAIISLINGTQMQRYATGAYIMAIILYFFALKNESVLEQIPFKNKGHTIAIVCFIPILFLNRGVYDGEVIQSGKNTFLVESNSKCTNDNSTKYRYIDSVSDKVFALSLKDNSICIFKYEYIKLTKEKT